LSKETICFYDTNAILKLQSKIFTDRFYISSVTLQELENIKTSHNKDEETKYNARKILHLLDEHQDEYDVVIYTNTIESYINDNQIEITPDSKIVASAAYIQALISGNQSLVFVTDDISCKVIAKNIFLLSVKSVDDGIDDCNYFGFAEKTFSDEEMSDFYLHLTENRFDLLENEYLIIRKSDGEVVDTLRWNDGEYKKVCNKTIKSTLFGDKIKPKDVYQSCAIDSILNNTITAITGKAGSGKSLISLITIMNLIETGKYDRLIIMFNPTKAKGASDMGFYSGDAIEKAMQNSIGSILTTKFGDRFAVDLLLQQEKIKLVSMADIRGMEIRDNEILWITECQNTSIELLKLCLSRASSGCKIVIEGDYTSQVDSYMFEKSNNGLRRAINVFKGYKEFGYIQLQNVWRSKIAELCELL
jgi:predicted ribonuclease YlaK